MKTAILGAWSVGVAVGFASAVVMLSSGCFLGAFAIGKASAAPAVHTVMCDPATGFADLDLPGMTATEIAAGVTAFGHLATPADGFVGGTFPSILAQDGKVRVTQCGGFTSVDFLVH